MTPNDSETLLAQIGFARFPEPSTHPYNWKRIGALYLITTEELEYVELRLRGFRFGEFKAKALAPRRPYIQGDILSDYMNSRGDMTTQWIGRIYSAQEHDVGTLYYGTLEVMPICVMDSEMPLRLHVHMDEYMKGDDDGGQS